MNHQPISTAFADLSSRDLANLVEANLIERSLYFPRFFRGEIHGPNPVWFITGPAMRVANGIVTATFAPPELDSAIEAALIPFKVRRLPMKWWVGPSSAPQDLGRYLQKHGLTHNRDMMGMAVPVPQLPEPVPPIPGLTFEVIEDRETLVQWYRLFVAGFPVSFDPTYLEILAATSLRPDSPERHYVARHNGEIAGISTLFLGGGVTGLYNLTTHPRVRGQGLGTWLTIKTYQEGLNLGYHIGTLQTTYPNALRLYHQLGFEVYGKIGIYQYVPQK
ncbi:MAG: GNAT family N-acetyltransferase [Anaerolineae bacterium]|nr:GNAT family N-acetyltransferase [Anaerolineae bacterium]